MTNRSTGTSPFSIVYTKSPNTVLDVAVLPKCQSKAAATFTDQFTDMLFKVRQQLIQTNQKYKRAADVHRRQRIFNVGDLVMIRLRRERFPVGQYSKLARRKIGPLPILTKINDNAYTVALPADCNTSPTFNVSDIWPYFPPDDGVLQFSSSESSSSDTGED
ncbi:uncharacterized protein LOC110103791 [Dendrobium catenatum]|uniref:uncharacterized protein LOC110103791 n=1 Tax=Dendrobium catenatum TaxID=906689 RepID=UPI0009F43B4C|nr:uncharacterized protein LOC110103791 [Dendrobium catenatum]